MTAACAQLHTEGCGPIPLQLKTGEDGAVTKSHGRVSLVTVSKGCILYVWSGAELRAGGAHTFGEGTFTEEQLSDVLKEPALAYSCECEKAESLSRKKRATFEDFQERHVISPSPVPNTNEGWTQLMRERRLFGRPINTFIHGEVDQIRQAFDLQDQSLQYYNHKGLVHWSKYKLPTTNLRLIEDEYRVAVKARMKYVAVSFRNGLPVHLDKASSRPPPKNMN
ncbi:UNVERIFIED_CONTAM: hypothetical protein FKN15_006773 [Acipenser sinensis]